MFNPFKKTKVADIKDKVADYTIRLAVQTKNVEAAEALTNEISAKLRDLPGSGSISFMTSYNKLFDFSYEGLLIEDISYNHLHGIELMEDNKIDVISQIFEEALSKYPTLQDVMTEYTEDRVLTLKDELGDTITVDATVLDYTCNNQRAVIGDTNNPILPYMSCTLITEYPDLIEVIGLTTTINGREVYVFVLEEAGMTINKSRRYKAALYPKELLLK